MTTPQPPLVDEVIELAGALTPLQITYLRDCVDRGSTRTSDEGLADTILSGLCSHPSLEDSLVRWQMNPNFRFDGYINLYEPTSLGLLVISYIKTHEDV